MFYLFAYKINLWTIVAVSLNKIWPSFFICKERYHQISKYSKVNSIDNVHESNIHKFHDFVCELRNDHIWTFYMNCMYVVCLMILFARD